MSSTTRSKRVIWSQHAAWTCVQLSCLYNCSSLGKKRARGFHFWCHGLTSHWLQSDCVTFDQSMVNTPANCFPYHYTVIFKALTFSLRVEFVEYPKLMESSTSNLGNKTFKFVAKFLPTITWARSSECSLTYHIAPKLHLIS